MSAGASAVENVLHNGERADLRVFIVWEPVLDTDWGEPGQALTGYVPDRRTTHFWDAQRRLSALYGGVAHLDSLAEHRHIGFRMKDPIWDAAFVYPPGMKWGGVARILVAPVFKYESQLHAALQ